MISQNCVQTKANSKKDLKGMNGMKRREFLNKRRLSEGDESVSRSKHSFQEESRSQEPGSKSPNNEISSSLPPVTTQRYRSISTAVPKHYKGKRRKSKRGHKKNKKEFDFSSNTTDIHIPKINLLGLPAAMNAKEQVTVSPPIYQHPNVTLSVLSETTYLPNSHINKKDVVSISVPIIALAIFGFLAIAVCFARTFTSKRIKNFYYVANDDVSGVEMNPHEYDGTVELGPYGYDYDV